MRFVYEYRTSDNVRHDGEIAAPDREAAFRKLKEAGIKPGRLIPAPGVVNAILGHWKLWLAAGGLVAVALAAAAVIRRDRITIRSMAEETPYADADGFAKPVERRQIWGDEAVIATAARKNWRIVFENPADRLLALFAEPGVGLSMMPRLPETLKSDMDRALAERFRIVPDELDEYKQIKCIVEGMKSELRTYMAAGGTLEGYIRRLMRRQSEERDYLLNASAELGRQIEAGADPVKAWEEMNHKMREQGLPALPMPEVR